METVYSSFSSPGIRSCALPLPLPHPPRFGPGLCHLGLAFSDPGRSNKSHDHRRRRAFSVVDGRRSSRACRQCSARTHTHTHTHARTPDGSTPLPNNLYRRCVWHVGGGRGGWGAPGEVTAPYAHFRPAARSEPPPPPMPWAAPDKIPTPVGTVAASITEGYTLQGSGKGPPGLFLRGEGEGVQWC